jgi:hypothetical protein
LMPLIALDSEFSGAPLSFGFGGCHGNWVLANDPQQLAEDCSVASCRRKNSLQFRIYVLTCIGSQTCTVHIAFVLILPLSRSLSFGKRSVLFVGYGTDSSPTRGRATPEASICRPISRTRLT